MSNPFRKIFSLRGKNFYVLKETNSKLLKISITVYDRSKQYFFDSSIFMIFITLAKSSFQIPNFQLFNSFEFPTIYYHLKKES